MTFFPLSLPFRLPFACHAVGVGIIPYGWDRLAHQSLCM